MITIIFILQLATLLLVGFLVWAVLRITNRLGFLNSEKLVDVAESAARLEAIAAEVAQDLSNAHARADAVEPGHHGEAADAASQQTEKEKIRNNNPHLR